MIEAETFYRVVTLKERNAHSFPRTDLFSPDGLSLILSRTRDLRAVEIRDTADSIQVRARGIVGYLPLTPSITLNIVPKFPIGNLWRMLTDADEQFRRILSVQRAYETSGYAAPDLMLARAFCHYLAQILALGISKGYRRTRHRGVYRPKVNFGETMAAYLSRGDEINVSSDLFTFSADLKANRILKSACIDFLRLAPKSSNWMAERRLLFDSLNALDRVRQEPMVPGGWGVYESAPPWLREPYRGALNAYSILLGYTSIGFRYGEVGHDMPSFLLALDDVFEIFVRNACRRHLRDAGIAVLDGNLAKHQRPLFQDNKAYPIKPDLIFRIADRIVAVGDAKYKPKLEEVDRYQVITHTAALGAGVGLWVSPADEGGVGLEYVGSFRTGQRFYHYRLDLSGDLDESCANMTAAIGELIKKAA